MYVLPSTLTVSIPFISHVGEVERADVFWRNEIEQIKVNLFTIILFISFSVIIGIGRREDVQNILLIDCNVAVWFLSLLFILKE